MRDLFAGRKTWHPVTWHPLGMHYIIADYTGFLQIARRYDRQQQALRYRKSGRRGAREKAYRHHDTGAGQGGFLDYLNVI